MNIENSLGKACFKACNIFYKSAENTSRTSNVSGSNKINPTAFKNKNDNIAIVAMNLSDETLNYSITIDLKTSRLKL